MSATDQFESFLRRPAGGPRRLVEVVPDDAQDLGHVAEWLFLGTGGDLRLTTPEGDLVTLKNLLPGWHALEIARVHATGTTAADIVVGW